MIIIESILLWFVAACALLLIMQNVMKTPQTPQKPQLGLGKRYPVGAKRLRRVRHVEEETIDMEPPPAPVKRRTSENRHPVRTTVEQVAIQEPVFNAIQTPVQQIVPQPVPARVEQVELRQAPIHEESRQATIQPVQAKVQAEVQAEVEEPIALEVKNARKNKKRTDTMQMMLNRAIAERR